ncbi:hypothetical protein HZC20_00560 [Candidatus Peregrinibacteria bacterium]|nr:hypothetical protein [Candidatus Peregrinibacteria bacterium]
MKYILLFILFFLIYSFNAFAKAPDESDRLIDALEPAGKIYMQQEKIDKDIFKISVLAQDFAEPVLGLSFHLIYENDKASFLRYEPGDFLEKGGDPIYLVKNNSTNHSIIFGETLRKNDNFPVGKGIIAYFYFQVLDNSENLLLKFYNGSVSGIDSTKQDIKHIYWQNLDLNLKENPLNYSSLSVIDSYEKLSLPYKVLVVFVFCFSLISAYFLAKNHRKKRADTYVNFK